MQLKFIYKLKKRIIFEVIKIIKKMKFFLFKEWITHKKHGSYIENRVVQYNIDKMRAFYEKNEMYKLAEISDAERVLKGELNLIYFDNSKIIENWNMDYESGVTYPLMYFGDIKYIVNDDKTDVKNVWELSRLHHLVIISKAYAITSDEKYYSYFKKSINSWLEANPNGRSVNWTCNMEVSVRVTNIIICYELLKEKLSKDRDFEIVLKSTIYYHNKHIAANLENYSDLRNNHYLSNLMGLLISSKFLENKDSKKYKKYQRFSRIEIQMEMDKQIYDDGVTYEISTSYQKLVYEILLFSIILGQSEDNKFENKYINRLHDMFVFLKSVSNLDGTIPLFGDNDSGSILVFNDYFNEKRTNLPSLINLSEYFFNPRSEIKDDTTLYLGCKSEIQYKKTELKESYQSSGYYILKKNSFKMVLLCGPLSMKGQGGHSHNDQLSFILNVNNIPVFIDPGTITYTGNSELRNYSRRTSSHNTVQIEEEEQNIIGSDLFALKERTYSKCISYSGDTFSGVHHGFKNRYNSSHKRTVNLEHNKITIVDSLTNNEQVNYIVAKLNLVLSRDVKIVESDGLVCLEFEEYKLITNLKYGSYSIEDVLVSERYGHFHKSKKITCEFTGVHELIMSLK
jgi:hypothetical protein